MSPVRIRRVYEPAAPDDGHRVLVDRVWPRGVSRERAQVDEWRRDLAPSTALRRWFGHDAARFDEFRRRYRAELQERPEAVARLVARARDGVVTLVYAARDEAHNNAVVLGEVVEQDLAAQPSPGAGARPG